MPAAEVSISDTTTPMMASAPPSRSPESTVGIDAGMTTRVICWGRLAPMLRAATRKLWSMVWMPAAVDSMTGKKP